MATDRGRGRHPIRLQVSGYRLLLAHPERYSYLDLDTAARLVDRDVKLQLELGSFVGGFGDRAQARAMAMMNKGLGHVLATDLHRPKQAEMWLAESLAFVHTRFGGEALKRGVLHNPQAMLDNAGVETIEPLVGESAK